MSVEMLLWFCDPKVSVSHSCSICKWTQTCYIEFTDCLHTKALINMTLARYQCVCLALKYDFLQIWMTDEQSSTLHFKYVCVCVFVCGVCVCVHVCTRKLAHLRRMHVCWSFWDRVSLPGCPGTQRVDQEGFKLTELPLPLPSQWWESKVLTAIIWLQMYLYN